MYAYQDKTRDIQSNIVLRLREIPRAKLKGTPEDGGLYLTVYPESSPNMGSISFLRTIIIIIPSLISSHILLRAIREVLILSIPLLERVILHRILPRRYISQYSP